MYNNNIGIEKKQKRLSINIKNMITFFIVIFPWAGNYRFFFPGFSLGDLFLIIVLILYLYNWKGMVTFNNKKVNNSYKILALYILYALFISLISLLIGDIINYVNVIKRSIKMTFYYGMIIFIIPNAFRYDYFIKIYKKVVYISCIAIIIQYLGYYLGGIYINFKIPFLYYNNESLENFNFAASRLSSFRPDSIFLEPSHFVYYITGYIPLVLFNNKRNILNIIEGSLISLMLLMSRSSSAIFLLIVIWFFFIIQVLGNGDFSFAKKIKIISIIFIMLLILFYIFLNTDLFISAQRMMFNHNERLATNVWSKIYGGRSFVEALNPFQKLFGVGLGNYYKPIFTTSINFIIYSTGYIGLFIISIWTVKSYTNSNNIGKVIIIISVILSIEWYLIYAPIFVLYCTLIIYNKKATPCICQRVE